MALTIETVSNSSAARADLRQVRNSVDGIQKSVESVKNSFAALAVTIGSVAAATVAVSSATTTLDKYANIKNRIKASTKEVKAQEQAFRNIKQIVIETGTAIEAVSAVYTKAAISGERFGASQRDLAKFTRAVNQTLKISGATAAEANSALLQLGQGLASNRFQGEELRAVFEAAPTFALQLAKGLDVPFESLRKMGEEGLLTFSSIFNAINKQSGEIGETFDRLAITYSRAFTNLGSAFSTLFYSMKTAIFGDGDELPRWLDGVAKSIFDFAENLKFYLLQAKIEFYFFRQAVRDTFNDVYSVVESPFALIKGLAAGVVAIFAGLNSAASSLGISFRDIGQSVVDFVKPAVTLAVSLFEDFINITRPVLLAFVEVFSAIGDTITDIFEDAFGNIRVINVADIFPDLSEGLKYIQNFAEKAEYYFWWLYDRVIGNSWIPDLVEGTIEWTSELLKKPLDFVSGFTSESADMFKKLAAAGVLTALAIRNVGFYRFGKLFGIISALGVAAGTLAFTIQRVGSALGFNLGTFKDLLSFVQETFATIRDGLFYAVYNIGKLADTGVDGMKRLGVSIRDNIVDGFSSAIDYSKNAWQDLIEWFNKTTMVRTFKQIAGMPDKYAGEVFGEKVDTSAQVGRGIDRNLPDSERFFGHDFFYSMSENVREVFADAFKYVFSFAIIGAFISERVRSFLVTSLTSIFALGIASGFTDDGVLGSITGFAKNIVESIGRYLVNLAKDDPLFLGALLLKFSLLFKAGREMYLNLFKGIAKTPSATGRAASDAFTGSAFRTILAGQDKTIEKQSRAIEKQTENLKLQQQNILRNAQNFASVATRGRYSGSATKAFAMERDRTRLPRELQTAQFDNYRKGVQLGLKQLDLQEEQLYKDRQFLKQRQTLRTKIANEVDYYNNQAADRARRFASFVGSVGGTVGGAVGLGYSGEVSSRVTAVLEDMNVPMNTWGQIGIQIGSGIIAMGFGSIIGSAMATTVRMAFVFALKSVLLKPVTLIFSMVNALLLGQKKEFVKSFAIWTVIIASIASLLKYLKEQATGGEGPVTNIIEALTGKGGPNNPITNAIGEGNRVINVGRQSDAFTQAGGLDAIVKAAEERITEALRGLEVKRENVESDALARIPMMERSLGLLLDPSKALNEEDRAEIARINAEKEKLFQLEKSIIALRDVVGLQLGNESNRNLLAESSLFNNGRGMDYIGRMMSELESEQGKLLRRNLETLLISTENIKTFSENLSGPLSNLYDILVVPSQAPLNKASGGIIRGPGGPRDDSIPANLSNGEFVVNAASTKKYRALLEQINRQRVEDQSFKTWSEIPALGMLLNPNSVDLFRNLPGNEMIIGPQKDAEKAAQRQVESHKEAVRTLLKRGTQDWLDSWFSGDDELRKLQQTVIAAQSRDPLAFDPRIADFLNLYTSDAWKGSDNGKAFAELAERHIDSITWARLSGEQDYLNMTVGNFMRDFIETVKEYGNPLKRAPGEIPPQAFANGGSVYGAGGPTDDKIPALLSNGEFVINAKATARNRALLEAINSGKTEGFNTGGGLGLPPTSVSQDGPGLMVQIGEAFTSIADNFADFLKMAEIQFGEPGLISNVYGQIKEFFARFLGNNEDRSMIYENFEAMSAKNFDKAVGNLFNNIEPFLKNIEGVELTREQLAQGSVKAIDRIASGFTKLADLQTARRNAVAEYGTNSRAAREAADLIKQQREALKEQIENAFGGAGGSDGVTPVLGLKQSFDTVSSEMGELELTFNDFAKMPKELRESIAKGAKAIGEARTNIEAGDVGVDSGFAEFERKRLERVDSAKEAMDASYISLADTLRNFRIIGITSSDIVQANSEQFEELSKKASEAAATALELKLAQEQGLPVARELAESYADQKREIEKLNEAILKFTKGAIQSGESLSGDVQSSFKNGLANVLSDGDFKSFFDSVMDTFTRSVLDAFASGVTDKLFDGFLDNMFNRIGSDQYKLGAGELFGGSDANAWSGDTPGKDPRAQSKGFFASVSEGFSKLGESLEGTFFGPIVEGFRALGGFISEFIGGMFSGGGGFDWGGLIGGIAGAFGGSGLSTSGGMTSSIGGAAGSGGTYWAALAGGGPVRGPGTATSDSIPALLSDGEFVVNAREARKNYALISAINEGKVRKFARGGPVSSVDSAGYIGGQQININITGDISRQTKSEIYKMLPSIAQGVNQHNREKGNR